MPTGSHARPDAWRGHHASDFNLYALNTYILDNAASFGFTNTSDPCYTDTPFTATTSSACGPDAENIGSFFYWDDIHPTERVQALWAKGFMSAVPEPSTWAMLLVGFGSMGFAGYRRGARALAARAERLSPSGRRRSVKGRNSGSYGVSCRDGLFGLTEPT